MSEFEEKDFQPDGPEDDPNIIGYNNYIKENPNWENEHHGNWIGVIDGQVVIDSESDTVEGLLEKTRGTHDNKSMYFKQIGTEHQ
jgi:hypothetical protein